MRRCGCRTARKNPWTRKNEVRMRKVRRCLARSGLRMARNFLSTWQASCRTNRPSPAMDDPAGSMAQTPWWTRKIPSSMGRLRPCTGRIRLSMGKDIPSMGGTAPHTGKTAPCIGTHALWMGQTSPCATRTFSWTRQASRRTEMFRPCTIPMRMRARESRMSAFFPSPWNTRNPTRTILPSPCAFPRRRRAFFPGASATGNRTWTIHPGPGGIRRRRCARFLRMPTSSERPCADPPALSRRTARCCIRRWRGEKTWHTSSENCDAPILRSGNLTA
jgi:hypothetical protein